MIIGAIVKFSRHIEPDREVIKLFMLNSIQFEIYPAHNVKMPTIVGILTFMSWITIISECLAGTIIICLYFKFYTV